MSIDLHRVQAVFQAVAGLPPGERAAALDRECGEDAELRRHLDALLKAHDDSAELPAAGVGPTGDYSWRTQASHGFVSAVETGQLFAGRYKLREKLGEGGMGVVFVADQTEPVQRRVALKVIRCGMDTHRLLARFEQERQALALMDHPNIAKVFDAGVDEGREPSNSVSSHSLSLAPHPSPLAPHPSSLFPRPYFAMELVKGLPLTKYCDDARLSPRQRLELFVPICHAVQHAHQKGIIHRDLKPSNILVGLYDGRPVPKVIDFGVAKATGPRLTEQSVYTEVGSIIGTLEYMSPEQAELNNLDIDTRSDIYALGVILYELLTGTVPFGRKELEKAGLAEMLRTIKEAEPLKPSTKLSNSGTLPSIAAQRQMEPAKLAAMMRGELDWIVMKALEKDRGRRYETANGLAMEIQRYLANEPVLAGPPTLRYRLRKFVARHKATVAAVSIILLCLLGGIIGTSAGLVWAMQERDDKAKALSAETDAKEAAIKAGQAKERALAAETQARAAEQQARDKALTALRSLTDDVIENQMARGLTLTEDNKEFLRKVIKQYEGFAAITADDADSRSIRAEGYLRVGRMRSRLGELKEAEAALTEALAIGKRLVADFPKNPEFRRGLASSHNNLGLLLKATGRPKEAERAHIDALAIQKQLAEEFTTSPEFRQDLATSYNNLGILLNDTSRPKEAEKAYADALAIQKQLVIEFSRRPDLRCDLARSHVNLGNMLKTMFRFKDAEAAYSEGRAILKQLAADFPRQPEFRHGLAMCCDNLGALLQATLRKDRLKDAETAHTEALAIFKQLAADFFTRPEFRQDLALSYNNLAGLLVTTNRRNEAEKAYGDALTLYKQLAADFPKLPDLRSSLAGTCGNLARLCNQRRDFRAAKAYLEEALPHHHAALQTNARNPMYCQSFRNTMKDLIAANAGLQDQAAALQEARKLRDLGWDPPVDAHYAGHALALCIPVVKKDQQLDAGKRRAAAEFYADEAMNMLRGAVGKGWMNPALFLTKDPAFHPLHQRDDFKKLLAEVQADGQPHGQGHASKVIPFTPPEVVQFSLGNVLEQQGDLAGASAAFKKAIALKPDYADAHNRLGIVLAHQGDLPGAIAAFQKAIAVKPDLAGAHYNLGMALRGRGDLPGAIAAYQKAIALKPDHALAHNNLGVALRDQGDLPGAVAAYRKAIALNADSAEAHCNLGIVLRQQGQFAAALEELRRGHVLGSKDPDWRHPSAQWVRQCQNLLELDGRLSDILAGKTAPAKTAERIALAELCAFKRRNRSALRFYEEAFAAQPALVPVHRYNAACVAALAGCGRGQDAGKLDDKERGRLRALALGWLRADLETQARLLDKEPARAAAKVAKTLQHWLMDADLGGVRAPQALAKLPQTERPEWDKLWTDVAGMLKRAQGNTASQKTAP